MEQVTHPRKASLTNDDCFRLVATDKLLQDLLVELDLVPVNLQHGSLGHRQFKALCDAWRSKDAAPRNGLPVIGDLIAFVNGGYGVVTCVELSAPKPFESTEIYGVPFRRGVRAKTTRHGADDIDCIVAGSPARRIHLNGKAKK